MKSKFFVTVLVLIGMFCSAGIFAQSRKVPAGWTIRFVVDFSQKMSDKDVDGIAANCLKTFVTQMTSLRDETTKAFADVNYHFDAVYQREADEIEGVEKPKWQYAHASIEKDQKAGKISAFNKEAAEYWTDRRIGDKGPLSKGNTPYYHFLCVKGRFDEGDDATKETDWDDFIREEMNQPATLAREKTIYIFCAQKMPHAVAVRDLNEKLAAKNSYCIVLNVSGPDNQTANAIVDAFSQVRKILLPQKMEQVSIECVNATKDNSVGKYTLKVNGIETEHYVTGVDWIVTGAGTQITKKGMPSCEIELNNPGKYLIVAKISHFNTATSEKKISHEVRQSTYAVKLKIGKETYENDKNKIYRNPGIQDTVRADILATANPAYAVGNLEAVLQYDGEEKTEVLSLLPNHFMLRQNSSGEIVIREKRKDMIVKKFKFTIQKKGAVSDDPKPRPQKPNDAEEFSIDKVQDDKGNDFALVKGVYQVQLPAGEEHIELNITVKGADKFAGTVNDGNTKNSDDGVWRDVIPAGEHIIVLSNGNKKFNVKVRVLKADGFEIAKVTANDVDIVAEDGGYQVTLPQGSENVEVAFTVSNPVDGTFAVAFNDVKEDVKDAVWKHIFAAGSYELTFTSGTQSIKVPVEIKVAAEETDAPPSVVKLKVKSVVFDSEEIVADNDVYTITVPKKDSEAEVTVNVEGNSEGFTVKIGENKEEVAAGVSSWTGTFKVGTYYIDLVPKSGTTVYVGIKVETKRVAAGPDTGSENSGNDGNGLLWIILGLVIAGVIAGIFLMKKLGNKIFTIALNDQIYDKNLAPGEYKIDSSIFPDCEDPFSIILSTKKDDGEVNYFVQFKLMPNWTLAEGSRSLILNGECSDELQVGTEVYIIRTPRGTMNFKVSLKDN